MSRPLQQTTSRVTTPVSPVLELKSFNNDVSTLDEKRTDPQQEVANRMDEDPTKSSERVGSDPTVRETGDLFNDSRAQGKLLQKSGHYQEALEHYRVALQCKNKTFVSEPKDVQATFGDILYDIGTIHWYSEHGNPEQSLEAFHFCAQVRRTCFGSTHPAVARVLYELASLHSSADDHECALQLLLEALSIFLSATPEDRSTLHNVWTAIGNTQQALGFEDEAKSAFQEAEQFK